MRNSNGTKYVIIMALLVSVVALSLGFAALTNTLTIKSSATVGPGTFQVDLSTSKTASTQASVTPTTTGGATGANASMTTTTLSGLAATFTAPGQSVVYTLAAYNSGQFLAYLNEIQIGSKTCTPGTNTTSSYVTAACNGISISVKVGSDSAVTVTDNDIDSHSLAKAAGEDVVVTISYASGSAVADGDFTVAFGDVKLIYGSVD